MILENVIKFFMGQINQAKKMSISICQKSKFTMLTFRKSNVEFIAFSILKILRRWIQSVQPSTAQANNFWNVVERAVGKPFVKVTVG